MDGEAQKREVEGLLLSWALQKYDLGSLDHALDIFRKAVIDAQGVITGETLLPQSGLATDERVRKILQALDQIANYSTELKMFLVYCTRQKLS